MSFAAYDYGKRLTFIFRKTCCLPTTCIKNCFQMVHSWVDSILSLETANLLTSKISWIQYCLLLWGTPITYSFSSYLLGQLRYEFSMLVGSPLVRQHPLLGILQTDVRGLGTKKTLFNANTAAKTLRIFIKWNNLQVSLLAEVSHGRAKNERKERDSLLPSSHFCPAARDLC